MNINKMMVIKSFYKIIFSLNSLKLLSIIYPSSFHLGLMAVLVPLFLKNMDFDTPISKSAILVPLFCQILKLHTSLFSFDDVAFFNIT
jgi:hypothetical protein